MGFGCNQPCTGYKWCRNCNSKRFQRNFDKWTSGNKYIDELIQETQIKADKVTEWIPYDRLSNIKYFDKGGFSTIYKATWLDGPISYWGKQGWERDNFTGINVILKSLNNSSNINNDFLNELKNHLHMSSERQSSFVRIYGITKDPETSNYMIVMQLMSEGNLRSNLLIKKYNPFEKYQNLHDIALALSTLHRNNLVHRDFHSGNILLEYNYTFTVSDTPYITDFGLSKPANETKSNEIYGVIPYMAPEVLRGKPYTKAADVYSFGIIMWEFTSGIPAFNNIPHDFNLSLKICKGLRPKIIEGTLPVYARLMKRCWDNDPNKRPTADELFQILKFGFDYYPKQSIDDAIKRIPIPENVSITKNHPLSCYTSRKIDYSERLNKTLAQEELSCKIIVDEEKEYTLLSESLVVQERKMKKDYEEYKILGSSSGRFI